MINEEDHTLGNIVRNQLLYDGRVRFAGYRKPHPLFDLVELKVQSNGNYEPYQLIDNACNNLVDHVVQISNEFDRACEEYDKQKMNQYDQMKFGTRM